MRELSDAMALRSVVLLLKRRWKMITIAGLLGAIVAGTIGFLTPPRYTAKAQMVVQTPVSNIAGTLDEASIETRVELLLSERHLEKVVEALRQDGVSLAGPQASLFGLWSGDESELSDVSEINILSKNVNAFKERQSRVIGVTYTASDPELAAVVANKSVAVFFETLGRNQALEREEKLRVLTAQLPRARAEAERTEVALQSYRAEAGLAGSERADNANNEMSDLIRLHSLARSELLQRDEKIKLLRRLTGIGGEDIESKSTTYIEALREVAVDLPAVRDQARLQAAVQQHLRQLTNEAERFSSRARTLQQRLETLRQALAEGQTAEVRHRELEREASIAAQLLQSLLQQHVALRSSSPEPLDVRIASPASPPEFPSSPNPILFIPPGMVVALVLAGLMAVVLERLDNMIRSQRDFGESLGVPCVGLIPKLRRKAIRRAHLDLQSAPFAPFSEAIRTIALSVLSAAGPSRPIVIAVTSSVQGEGKTILTTSLACYLALIEKRVLIVDLDFRNPGFGVAEAGVLDALRGQALGDLLIPIQNTSVDCLPMQAFPGDPLASFDVESFEAQVRKAGADYDYVVIDLGPLLGASETALFCRAADLILFSVAWGATSEDIARNALQFVEPSKVLGVLTKVDLRQHAKFRFGDFGEALSQRSRRPLTKAPALPIAAPKV